MNYLTNSLPLCFIRQNKVYFTLLLLRIILTLIPQTGYIHPDEFFQTIEVIAGDSFDIESNRPWEYNATFPIRSIFVSYMIVGFPYKILKTIPIDISSYWLVMFPRLFVCILSFLVDYFLYKMLRNKGEPYQNKLLILASSYVTLIYGTRTFSNAFEMVLLASLLYLVSASQLYSNVIMKQNELLTNKYKRTTNPVERVKLFKMKSSLPSHGIRNCIALSFVSVVGVFNRPTFLAFAMAPIFFWVHRGIGFKWVRFTEFHLRMVVYICASAVFTALFILIDSFYYGYITLAEIMEQDISLENFVVTPVNFLLYNSNTKKLSTHGVHPRLTHLVVNVPLLYNILGIIAIADIAFLLYRLITGNLTKLPCIGHTRCMILTTIMIPVFVLSYFPHQEPRFLIPLTLPLVYLYGDRLWSKRIFLKIWCILNISCAVFYGFIHQAGVYPLMDYLAKNMVHSNNHVTHLVTSHMYSVPVSLLMLPNTNIVRGTGSSKYVVPQSFVLHEMGTAESFDILIKRCQAIEHVASMKINRRQTIYLALPTSKIDEFKYFINSSLSSLLRLDDVKTFYPHISTEALPLFHNFTPSFYDSVVHLFQSFGLGLYRVTFL